MKKTQPRLVNMNLHLNPMTFIFSHARLLIGVLSVMICSVNSSVGQKPPANEKLIIKYTPGHYVATNQISDFKDFNEIAIRGVIKRYTWKKLEPKKGEYDFSDISADLDFLARQKKQLIVFIIDKSFDPTHMLPDYLSEFEINTNEGFCAKRWDPYVIARLVSLGQALADKFDIHPNFEGIAIQESSLGYPDLALYEYTPEKYRDGLISILTGLKSAMKHSQVFWYMNYLNQNNNYLRDITKAIVPYKVAIGGPDILPYRTGLHKWAYPLYKEFRNKLPLFCSAQNDSFMHHKNDTSKATSRTVSLHPDGYLSMEEIFLFARDNLHANYIFWNYKTSDPGNGKHSWKDAIEVIRKFPEFNL